jgi:hypothetical protein
MQSSTNNFAHAQTLSRMSSLSCRMNIARVNIGFFTGFKKIKQQSISFVLGYLHMILWKISTAISIKHRILATFNIKKKFNSDSLYAFNEVHLREEWSMVKHVLVGYQGVSTSSSPSSLIPKDKFRLTSAISKHLPSSGKNGVKISGPTSYVMTYILPHETDFDCSVH